MSVPPNIAAAIFHAFGLMAGIVGILASRNIYIKRRMPLAGHPDRAGKFLFWVGIFMVVVSLVMVVVDIMNPGAG